MSFFAPGRTRYDKKPKSKKMRVPEGWFDYSRFGSPIDSTRIVAVKTPLKKQYNTGRTAGESGEYAKILRGVPIEEEFTPGQMLRLFKEKGWNVGLVIDLTFTDRYYDPHEFICQGVMHLKIRCPGHVIPPDNVYQQLATGISDFLSDPRNGSDLIAVHCTHGLNRTGYLVCRYLMERCGYDAERAIEVFNIGRGNSIERVNYLKHLRNGCPKEDTQPSSPRAQPDLSLVDHNSLSGRHYQGSGEDKRGRGGRQESRRRGAGSMQYDLRTKLDSKAASARTEERRRYVNHSDDWSDVRERGSRKRARYAEDSYGADILDYNSQSLWRYPPHFRHFHHYDNSGATPGYHTPNYTSDRVETRTGQSHFIHATDHSRDRGHSGKWTEGKRKKGGRDVSRRW